MAVSSFRCIKIFPILIPRHTARRPASMDSPAITCMSFQWVKIIENYPSQTDELSHGQTSDNRHATNICSVI